MLFKSIILFALSAAAYTIPENHPEGTYVVRYDANGTEVHTLLKARDVGPVLESAKYRLDKRAPGLTGINEVTCNSVAFPKSSADPAFAALQAACPDAGSVWEAGYSVYTYVTGGLAYYCNIDPWAQNRCYGSEVWDAIVNRVSGLCGSYQSGWIRNYDRQVVIGYGTRETRFCQAMLLSAKDG